MSTFGVSRRAPRAGASLFLLAAIAVGAAGITWFVATDAAFYFTFDLNHFTPYYWPRRYGLLMHIGGGLLALTVGLTQMWLGLSNRTQSLHRYLGRIYLLAVAVGCAGAFYLAVYMPP